MCVLAVLGMCVLSSVLWFVRDVFLLRQHVCIRLSSYLYHVRICACLLFFRKRHRRFCDRAFGQNSLFARFVLSKMSKATAADMKYNITFVNITFVNITYVKYEISFVFLWRIYCDAGPA